jgi:hypothetical protein
VGGATVERGTPDARLSSSGHAGSGASVHSAFRPRPLGKVRVHRPRCHAAWLGKIGGNRLGDVVVLAVDAAHAELRARRSLLRDDYVGILCDDDVPAILLLQQHIGQNAGPRGLWFPHRICVPFEIPQRPRHGHVGR